MRPSRRERSSSFLTHVSRCRHEKVQENCIDLVGRIADRGAEYVSTKEWIRICFALLDLLKAHKKAIRRAAVNTFGYIAKAIGPQVSRLRISLLLVARFVKLLCTGLKYEVLPDVVPLYWKTNGNCKSRMYDKGFTLQRCMPTSTPVPPPQDVLITLLNNLKVQERQDRVCTTVAIAIVAETCSPFNVVPHLMNEYRVPELNVQVCWRATYI